MKRFVRIWISALGLYFAASVPNWAQTTEQAPPLVGEPMAQVQQSGFFRWFALEKTNHHSTSGHVVTFRPSGARFHSLVRVEASVEGDREKISRLDLVLERSFIDSSSNGVFANDIAKSFLRAAAPQSDIATELADEIEGAETAGQPFLSSGRHTPQQPAEPSLGFLTFLGRRGS